jgi:peptidoglycan/xylan/chitin deacetylase (PgdA/CDA1 family)
MSPSWNWDFEDRPRHPPEPPAPPPPDPALPEPPQTDARAHAQIRRRRAGAGALAILLLLAALVIALAGSKHATQRASARVTVRHVDAAKRPARDTPEAEAKGVASVLAYTPFVKTGGERGRDIALTFDDGPGPYTPQVLSVLERLHVRATFFAIGKMLRYFSSSTVREIEDGDVIGDHTESHPMMATLSAHDQREQLAEQIARVELVGGRRPLLFRPPYGSFNATTIKQLHALHLLMILWSVDTDDYLQPGVSVIVERALAGAQPGAIILMHDAGGERAQTIAALPTIIRDLRRRGFHLVTVPQLLIDDPPPPGQPLPPSLSGD